MPYGAVRRMSMWDFGDRALAAWRDWHTREYGVEPSDPMHVWTDEDAGLALIDHGEDLYPVLRMGEAWHVRRARNYWQTD
jgi:hypothetical protein